MAAASGRGNTASPAPRAHSRACASRLLLPNASTAPGSLPETVDEVAMTDALVAFEKTGKARQAHAAYEAALKRWPRNPTLLLGAGNTAYAAGDREAAVLAFQRAVAVQPDNAPALNNLATVLAELGRRDEARDAAQRAVALGGPWRDAAQATLRSIEKK